jgi:hypothetical protein
MPRFVLLAHHHPSPHLDLMFEVGDVLRAWRIESLPAEGEAVRAVKNFDHRPRYLDYEGPIGGGRGEVTRVDRGEYVWREEGPARLVAEVSGGLLSGRLELVRQEGDEWRLTVVGRSAPA